MDSKLISSPLTRSINATKRERGRNQGISSEIDVGDIGYTFRKFFPGHGTFDGVVVDIHEGVSNGNLRRCVYTDGDDEDITLSHLRTLPQSKLTMDEVLRNYSPQNKISKKESVESAKRKKTQSAKQLNGKKQRIKVKKIAHDKNFFFSIDENVPIDEVAEATVILENQKRNLLAVKSIEKSSSENDFSTDQDDWIESVASILANCKKSKSGCTKLKKASNESATKAVCLETKNSKMSETSKLSPGLIKQKRTKRNVQEKSQNGGELQALLTIPPGKRHGQKVFHIKDPKRIVGEVILEHLHGIIEAIINGEVITGRSNLFALASDSKAIGESEDLSLLLPKRIAKHGIRTLQTHKEINATKHDQCERISKPPVHVLVNPITPKTNSMKITSSQSIVRSKDPNIVKAKENVELQSPNESEDNNLVISLDNVFYWRCNRCTMHNSYLKNRCQCCSARKSLTVVKSALLDIAENACSLASSIDEAYEQIPLEDQSTIPRIILSHILKYTNSIKDENKPSETFPVDTFFKWICSKCTAINSYKSQRCTVCETYRFITCKTSMLLKIALDAAYSNQSIKDAFSNIASVHQTSIPEFVLESVMTCSEIIGRNSQERRRCLKLRAKGMNFCSLHCEIPNIPDMLGSTSCNHTASTAQITEISMLRDSKNIDSNPINVRQSTLNGPLNMLSNMREFLSSLHNPRLNCRDWNIASVEDAILCQEKSPFPLGMLVRRFFPRYGFHDGWINLIQRKLLFDEEKRTSRPVLIYRVKYIDGDEEDFMHHEINSLRQIYNIRNISSTAPPCSQIQPSTIYECNNEIKIKVLRHITPSDAAHSNEGGRIVVHASEKGSEWTQTELDLIELQLNVVRRIKNEETVTEVKKSRLNGQNSSLDPKSSNFQIAPTFEWPTCASSKYNESRELKLNIDNDNTVQNYTNPKHRKAEWMLYPGLWLGLDDDRSQDEDLEETPSTFSVDIENDDILFNNKSSVRSNLSRESKWDPANVCCYLNWDPYKSMICQICKVDENDNEILICDGCQQGFHMYCVRPIMVSVPTDEWYCSRCSCVVSKSQPFQEIMNKLQDNLCVVPKFLQLPFKYPKDFYTQHGKDIESINLKGQTAKRQSKSGTSRSNSTVKFGSLHVSCNVQKNDWILPLPPPCLRKYEFTLTTMVAAMHHCGMTSYSEELRYLTDGVTEDMNDASLENIAPMSRRNIEIFTKFKENLKLGAFPPLKTVFDEKIGFTVEALRPIPRHTLISEYVGEVTTMERSGDTSSDSLMVLLNTGDPSTSLIIDPTRTGNSSRFFSGINNLCNISKRKANVRTRRFALDGKCRVALFTSKPVQTGEKLYYDYNAGIQGKDVVDWAKDGFYDTRNFFLV